MDLPHHAFGERDYIAMRTLTVVRQYLAAAFLLVIGLIAYGCGDSATVSEPAALGNLSVSDGTLEPPFTPATTSYIVQLPINISSTTITASPQVAGDSIRIDNQAITSQTITLSSPGAEQSITIVVTDTGTGGTSKSYTVQVKRAALNGNNSLDSLGISPGALAPTFEAGVLRYTASVANGIGSVTITPTLSDPVATITVNGQPAISGQARSINLQGGGQITTIPITITAQNGSTKTYEVSVSRGPSNNNNLQGLTITPGTLDPSFRANRTGYTVDVGSGVGSVTITPRLQDTTATMTVNGATTNSGQAQTITLNPAGQGTSIAIVVTAQNNTTKLYSVTVERAALGGNNNLSALTVSPGPPTPAFTAARTSYTVDVASTVASVTVTPTRQDSNATITMNGTPATSGQGRSITLNGAGSNTSINILVTAPNGSQKTYTVNVNRAALGGNNNLSGLTVSPGPLIPAFTAATTSYTVDVASTVASVSVTPTRQDSAATITVNGQPATSGQAQTITLNGPGSNTLINIAVTAPNGSQKSYTITVERAALGGNNNLSGLTVSPGPLTPAFTPAETNYTVDVGSSVTSITVTPTRQDPAATITVNGTPTNSGQARTVTLNGAGSNTLINIVVTAPNGSQKPYTITVERAALGGNNNLSGLTVSPGPLTPAFTPAETNYTVDVGSSVTSVSVTPTRQDSNATITVNGTPATSGQGRSITLNGAGSNTSINILVTAPNGSQKPYTITVERAALGGNNNLSGLTVSPGTLSPTFTAARTAYTVNAGSSDTSITVTSTPQDSSATVTINGQGGNSRSIPLPGGPSSTEIEVLVIAPNGTDKTYLITVNQPAPAAPPAPPTSAPDLVEADDSCSPGVPDPAVCAPGTSRDDNVTNVPRPGFSIPQPGSGETATLYINRNKDESSSTTGNLLRPSTPLPDGEYDITYTLRNSGGESDPSPIMMTPPPQLQKLRIDTTPLGGGGSTQ